MEDNPAGDIIHTAQNQILPEIFYQKMGLRWGPKSQQEAKTLSVCVCVGGGGGGGGGTRRSTGDSIHNQLCETSLGIQQSSKTNQRPHDDVKKNSNKFPQKENNSHRALLGYREINQLQGTNISTGSADSHRGETATPIQHPNKGVGDMKIK
ncbi:unnamed protein product [Lathyrus oleraceus]